LSYRETVQLYCFLP